MRDRMKRTTSLWAGLVLVCLVGGAVAMATTGSHLARESEDGSICRASDVFVPRTDGSEVVTVQPGCTLDLEHPVALTLGVDESGVIPGTRVDVVVTVNPRTDLAQVRVGFSTEGPVEFVDDGGPDIQSVNGSTEVRDLGDLPAGKVTTFTIPVIYGEGRSTIFSALNALSPSGEQEIQKNEALYMILEEGRVLSGMGGFLNLDLRRVEEDFEAGLLTEEEARALARMLSMPPVTIDQDPRPFIEPTPEEKALQEGLDPVADPDETYTPDDGVIVASIGPVGPFIETSASGMITVQGTVNWLDENGTSHPAFGMTVQVRDDELIGSELVDLGTTDVNGQYSFVVDNDDGFGAGDRDIFVRFRTANTAVSIETAGIFGAPYEADTAVMNEVPDGTTITENFTCANTGTGPSCGLTTGATYVAAYAATLNGSSFLSQIVLEWPGAPGSANYDGSDINLRPGDRWDWDVMFHEYGHYVMDTFNFENNPGGPHNLGDCISDVQGTKSQGVRMAWAEGWPTFFGTAGQQILNLVSLNVPRVGDVSYADTGESNFSYSLESQDNLGLGEDNELATQRILWDLFDAPADSRDTVQVTDQSLFDTVNAADPTTFSAAWTAIRAPLTNAEDLAHGEITTDHFVGPALSSPADGSLVGPGATYMWTRNVGCSTTFDGDDFDLVFYDAGTLNKVLTLPGISGTSRTLSLPEFDTLIASGHVFRWAVEGSNGDGPATGPYLGENSTVTLNRPPMAEAGPDQLDVECTSPSGALVMLDGTGSSDPDDDPLTYAWSAPGIVFDNPASSTPSATFPEGTKTVTLEVSDGLESDDDTMLVEVVDTTAPTINCPADIEVECNEAGGVDASDPAIQAFLAGASANDVCDPNPIITDDAPGFFPLGATVVTFTATDDDQNSSDCAATVTVVDTTPPEIEVTVDPEILWPPNHKFVEVNATVTVTDVCDPNPTFVLTSVTSNEPLNDLGDGNTDTDIQGGAFGTADTGFELRAERAGLLEGRIYTITYTAMDMSGNTNEASVQAIVPHNSP
jgi:hypothetical protein